MIPNITHPSLYLQIKLAKEPHQMMINDKEYLNMAKTPMKAGATAPRTPDLLPSSLSPPPDLSVFALALVFMPCVLA
jgi:hypothetical protein